jgi:hypothetical protein
MRRLLVVSIVLLLTMVFVGALYSQGIPPKYHSFGEMTSTINTLS